jgi:hypothetical protein
MSAIDEGDRAMTAAPPDEKDAEIARLREALTEIRDLSGGGYEFTESTAIRAWEISFTALNLNQEKIR